MREDPAHVKLFLARAANGVFSVVSVYHSVHRWDESLYSALVLPTLYPGP